MEYHMCERCNGTGEVDSGGFDPQGHSILITCQCQPEYYETCSVAEWHSLSKEKRISLIDLEIAKCKADRLADKCASG